MGFFDSFSKKKENVTFNLSELPPPPAPKDSKKVDFPLPEKSMPAPPMPPPSAGIISKDNLSVHSDSAQLPINITPIRLESNNKNPFFLAESRPPELPKKLSFNQESLSISSAPQSLPSMPMPNLASKKDYSLGVFSDTYEEVPFFTENSALVELPTLNISDAEEKGQIFPVSSIKSPLFIRTDNYSNVLTTIDTINDYIMVSTDAIYSLENLKKNSEVEHKNYKSVMEDIQRKLIYIDKVLFEKGVQ